MGCGAAILKKVLIMVFDDSYLKYIYFTITNKKLEVTNQVNFYNFKNKTKNILYTFLTNNQRWTWIHHFSGTYGTIIIYEGNDATNNIKEIENIVYSKYLIKRPLLLLFDKNKTMEKDSNYIETIRWDLLKNNVKLTVQFIDFNENQNNSELLNGIEWLENEIKKIGRR